MGVNEKQKLELTWIGKEQRPRLEPRILLEEPELSYHAPQRVTDHDLFDNRVIFGDNLLALKALEQEFTGKIKCIYIDPPYNTGAAFAHYDDGIEHSLWLSLMRDRLELLWRLLRDDGLLFSSIDAAEVFYLGVLCDELFGRENRIETMVWKKSYGGGSKSRFVVNQHEFILCYAKDITKAPNLFLPPDRAALRYYRHRDENYEQRGPYRLQPLATTSMDERPNLRYPIAAPDRQEVWPDKQWQWAPNRAKAALDAGELVFTKRKGKWVVSYKQYLRDEAGIERQSKPFSVIDGHYTQHGTYESMALFGLADKFSFPKPEGLLRQLIGCCTAPGDWVLDSFAGSGTTGAVAQKMGRRWLMVELGEHCHTHIVPRLRKVVDGSDQGGISEAVGWKGGGGFRYYRLAPSLLERDRWGNWVISKLYNAAMLAEAMCKHEGFVYAPSQELYWQHGYSTERDFIYVTTQTLTHERLAQISEDVGEDRSLLICCGAFRSRASVFPNLTLRKIPNAVLGRCEFGRDDYSLRIANLPTAPAATEQPEPTSALTGTPTAPGRRRKRQEAPTLPFGDDEPGDGR